MWYGYYYKIRDKWTKPLSLVPRWLSANAYPDLTTHIPDPPINTDWLSAPNYLPDSNLFIPIDLVIPSVTPTQGNVLQGILESVVNELEYIGTYLTNVVSSYQWNPTVNDPEFLWLVPKAGRSVTVTTTSGTIVELNRSLSEFDMYYRPGWKFMSTAETTAIIGFDLFPSTSEKREGEWHFLKYDNIWTPGYTVFYQHPYSGTWIPNLRTRPEDGFLGIYWEGSSLNLLTRRKGQAEDLKQVAVHIDGYKYIAERHHIWNSVDEFGLIFDVSRWEGEVNSDYKEWVRRVGTYSGSTRSRLGATLSSIFRMSEVFTLDESNTSYTISGTFYDVVGRELPRTIYPSEVLTPLNEENTLFLSLASNPRFGIINRGGVFYLPVPTATSGVYSIDASTEEGRTSTASWAIDLWDVSGNVVSATSSFSGKPAEFLVVRGVDVKEEASVESKKVSFNRNDPSLRWNTRNVSLTTGKGLSEFSD